MPATNNAMKRKIVSTSPVSPTDVSVQICLSLNFSLRPSLYQETGQGQKSSRVNYKMKKKIMSLYKTIDSKFFEQFKFHIRDTSLRGISHYMHKPKDASSLAVTRILFGIAMLFDIPDERGGARINERWGNPSTCHFPLLQFLQALPMPYMALVYIGLWLGALGIALGYKFRLSSAMFTVCFWYLLLIEKSYWNNHSYLFGLVGLLLTFTQANCYWSVDAYLDRSVSKQTVPYWNYFILKYQFFILYFMAGLKKGTAEWLTGYSVQNLSEHWVFNPFKLFLTVAQTDYLVVHWFVFVFDLTVAIWMMWSRTRHFAMLFCALFHLMNSRLFRIGMFPWVCLATMPLFYPFDWPKIMSNYIKKVYLRICKFIFMFRSGNVYQFVNRDEETTGEADELDDTNVKTIESEKNKLRKYDSLEDFEEQPLATANVDNKSSNKSEDDSSITDKMEGRKILTCIFICFYILTQAFLPFSHFITKGYNNWSNGLYGYSWDMMVHTWDVHSIVVKVVDREKESQFYVDPYHFTPNDRWTRHGDMVYQYARCLKENIKTKLMTKRSSNCDGATEHLSDSISIYVDVWYSLNGRFTQRMFDSKADLLTVSWSPFTPTPYLMPLLDEVLDWREHLHTLRKAIHSWNNYSDVIFIADFPGYEYEKYIPAELQNVTLTILSGFVVYELDVTQDRIGKSYPLRTGDWIKIPSVTFHKVHNVGEMPAFYMYTFSNISESNIKYEEASVPTLPIPNELLRRFSNMSLFVKAIFTSFFHMFLRTCKC